MFTQIMIIIFSGAAILLLNQNNRRLGWWGSLIGLCGQPFWFYSVWTAKPFQWGIALLVVAYTVAYAMGLHNFSFRKFKKERTAFIHAVNDLKQEVEAGRSSVR